MRKIFVLQILSTAIFSILPSTFAVENHQQIPGRRESTQSHPLTGNYRSKDGGFIWIDDTGHILTTWDFKTDYMKDFARVGSDNRLRWDRTTQTYFTVGSFTLNFNFTYAYANSPDGKHPLSHSWTVPCEVPVRLEVTREGSYLDASLWVPRFATVENGKCKFGRFVKIDYHELEAIGQSFK